MGFGILLKAWHLGTLKAQAKGVWEGAEAGSPHLLLFSESGR